MACALPLPSPPAIYASTTSGAPAATTTSPDQGPGPESVFAAQQTDTGSLPRPWVAGWASAFFPGGGFFYLHRPGTGLGYLGVESLELGGVIAAVANSGYDSHDATTNDRLNRLLLPGIWLQDTHALGIYDAYRAARIARKNLGYSTPVPEPGLAGLMLAPLEGHTLIRARVAIPLAITATGGVAFSLWFRAHHPADAPTAWERSRAPLLSRSTPIGGAFAANEANYAGTFYAVGIGEEALFRGVLQTTFDEWFGTVPGLLAGSAIFGLAHFINDPTHPLLAAGNVGFTAVLGTYLGWMYLDDGYDLRASVALHVWYDFLVGTSYFLVDPKHQPLSASITIPF